jgi:hypothetical protein
MSTSFSSLNLKLFKNFVVSKYLHCRKKLQKLSLKLRKKLLKLLKLPKKLRRKLRKLPQKLSKEFHIQTLHIPKGRSRNVYPDLN